MLQNTNISIIQLIRSGDFSVDYEISNIRAGKDLNINICTYLEKSDQYKEIEAKIINTKIDLKNACSIEDMLFFDQKLKNLFIVKEDFICNTIYLAETLSKIEPRTDKLKKAIDLFEIAQIYEADLILNEFDLINDQFNLIAINEYQEKKTKNIENELYNLFN